MSRLFREIRWRVKACYDIGWWVIVLGSPMRNWRPIGNRAAVIKWAWDLHREEEFPRRKYTWTGKSFEPAQVEVMPVVTGHKDSSILPPEEILSERYNHLRTEGNNRCIGPLEPIEFKTAHTLEPVGLCTDGKIRPIDQIR